MKTVKKPRKKPRKFHSLKRQISVLFIGLLLLSIFTITLINGLFLEKYYVSKKVEDTAGSQKCTFPDEPG